MTRRRTMICTALLPALVPHLARGQATPRTLTYGLTSKSANDRVNFLSEKLGFFTANGVKPDFVVVGSAAGNAQQLTSGSLDLGGIASPQLIEAVLGGAPLTCVFGRTRVSPYSIVAKKGFTSVKQLKGKTIIVDSPAGITRLMVDGVLGRPAEGTPVR